jgi:translation initiation factor 1
MIMALVYSTDQGRLCPDCKQPRNACRCKAAATPPPGDGIVRIQRQVGGRGGKTVTVVSGLGLDQAALKDLARALKQRCGVGGAVRDFNIEIQGDQREPLRAELEKRGYKVKLSGG